MNRPPPPISQVSILVVISDQPLNLDPFLSAPSALRNLLGQRAYISEILAAERILATVIGDPGTAVTEHRILTVSLPGSWAIRRRPPDADPRHLHSFPGLHESPPHVVTITVTKPTASGG